MESKAIGKKVGALRQKQGITTTELAKRVGISQAQISRLENGKQGFRSATLTKIAKALGVKPIYFFINEKDESSGEDSVYGLAAGGELVEALKAAEFVQVVERMAAAFLHKKDAFAAVKMAVKAIVGPGKN
jgi:transcriptional regulator with XRE-family HTH domain